MKKRIILSVAFILAAALSAFAINPRDMEFEPLEFKPPEPVRFETDNGTIVHFLEDHQLPVVTVNVLFHGGNVYDPPEKVGLAEITARLLRSGGAGERTPEQVDYDLDFIAASISSAASSDELSLSMKAMKKDIELVSEVFSDILIRPAFDSGKFALEISNRKDAIRRQNDDPGPITRRIFYETIYAGHPYGQNPTLSSINNINRDGIIAQHNRYYAPDNCIMAVSGDMTLDDIKGIMKKYFGDWKRTGVEIEPPPTAVMKYKPGVYYAEKDINQANIRFGHLCMDIKNPDRYAMEVMNFALGGGFFLSRMMNQIRTTEGLAYSVGSYTFNRPLMGTFFAYCQTRADATAQAMQMMLDIIAEVRSSGITQEEMELARESIINSFVFGYDTPGKIAYAGAYNEYHGFPADQLERDLEAYRVVTLEECNRVAQKYLDPEEVAIIITGNKEIFDKPLETFGPVTQVSLDIK